MFGRQEDHLQQFGRKVQAALNDQAKRIHGVEQQTQAMAQHLASQQAGAEASQTMADLHRREQHYTQVVMLAGYGAFFALWTQTRSEMSLWMFASTGTLICLSLIAFVGFELYKSWRLGNFFSSHKSPRPHEINQEVDLINKHWSLVFVFSAGTGLLSGLSLLLWFVYKTIVTAAGMATGA